MFLTLTKCYDGLLFCAAGEISVSTDSVEERLQQTKDVRGPSGIRSAAQVPQCTSKIQLNSECCSMTLGRKQLLSLAGHGSWVSWLVGYWGYWMLVLSGHGSFH